MKYILETTPVYRSIFTGFGVWCHRNFPHADSWNYHLSPATLNEIYNAVQEVRQTGRNLESVIEESFSIPSFEEEAIKVLQELKTGCGFLVLQGLPAEKYTDDEICMVYWSLSNFLGTVLVQNIQGDRLYSVFDKGYSQDDLISKSGVRGTQSRAPLAPHTDSAPLFRNQSVDVVGMFVLKPAKTGGDSLLISAKTLHNIILEKSPELLERLYQSYYFDRRAELQPGETPETLLAPIFSYKNCLSVRYSKIRIFKGYEAENLPIDSVTLESIGVIEYLIKQDKIAISLQLNRGEMLLVNNYSILHGRTAFEDDPQPEKKRRLMRIWLSSTF
ncbi:TauD/TfdA family dioxygenase [Nodosilinea sp. LEGE 07298]|uniref:TauD/TfdA family dioxygenase n=1 Tax=Nodosilinea sp. LEGE 07298 TaxID=2777970 RepID=UPI00187E8161|nr:TauD/TfdA family dioxygenase [Nodosilinea sp. LEGE 07298]MBE9108125.1 TauD/TfdA family dioxygenase [Nodosilinea sp. LEGE 07298]